MIRSVLIIASGCEFDSKTASNRSKVRYPYRRERPACAALRCARNGSIRGSWPVAWAIPFPFAKSEAVILNIDYPLGMAAYHLLSRLAQGRRSARHLCDGQSRYPKRTGR